MQTPPLISCLPLGAMPINAPKCVATRVQRVTTFSPSPIWSTTVQCELGNVAKSEIKSWRCCSASSSSAWGSVVETCLTPPALSETPDYVNHGLSPCRTLSDARGSAMIGEGNEKLIHLFSTGLFGDLTRKGRSVIIRGTYTPWLRGVWREPQQ